MNAIKIIPKNNDHESNFHGLRKHQVPRTLHEKAVSIKHTLKKLTSRNEQFFHIVNKNSLFKILQRSLEHTTVKLN